MHPDVDTILIVHATRRWDTFHRRHMLLALAEALPSHVALVCVDRPITFDVAPWKYPRRFWSGVGWGPAISCDGRASIVTARIPTHDLLVEKMPFLSPINTWAWRMHLKRLLRREFPAVRQVIQWIYHPVQRWVYNAWPDGGRIYECYDEYSRDANGRFLAGRWNQEVKVLRMADLAFVTTATLVPQRHGLTQRLAILPNGVSDCFFDDRGGATGDLGGIPRPRIGYVGHLRPPIDLALLESVFRKRADWSLVIIGPVNRAVDTARLKALPNVHLIGERPYGRIPDLLRQLDVGVIPFRVNAFSRPFKPLKLGEYLACGVPVVATQLPELAAMPDLVRTAPDDPEAFERAIEGTLRIDRDAFRLRAVDYARGIRWSEIARRHVLPELDAAFGILGKRHVPHC